METAEIAESLSGDKLYQQRARKALPILVRQALAGTPITYEDLADELAMPNPRNLNYVLGSIGTALGCPSSDNLKHRMVIPSGGLAHLVSQFTLPGKDVAGGVVGWSGA